MSTAECPRCGCRMRVETSRRAGEFQLQYLACRNCGGKARRAVKARDIFRKAEKC
jgi:transcription elongation factor Elf1